MDSTSAGQTISNTVTAGIQDISALLPLLGTEQCEDHASSALTKGFLYAAASPISLFGSLGVARAGFKTMISAISISPPRSMPWLKFEGAKLLADAGFAPQGINLSLIMFTEDQKSYCAEKHLDSMMKDLHFEDSSRVEVFTKPWSWNIKLILVSALSCIISIAPYIHLNLHGPNQLNHIVRWVFPMIRAVGGFLTTTMIQLVIQSRLVVIVRKLLILKGLQEDEFVDLQINTKGPKAPWNGFPSLDQRFSILERHVKKLKLDPEWPDFTRGRLKKCGPEKARRSLKDLSDQITLAKGKPILLWTFLLLLAGIVASIVGYVGCFSAVQGSSSSREAVIWLALEVGLSVIRVLLWGINPDCDDAPPLVFRFQLDAVPPLPTCTKTADKIKTDNVLPLVRAPEFLRSITSYAGLLQQFSDPALTLYYTLTRSHIPDDSGRRPPRTTRVLYITILDHTEGTTRVYTEDYGGPGDCTPYFYSADPITIDLEHGILKTRLGHEIFHKDDPIVTNKDFRADLQKHYQSILNGVNLIIDYDHLEDRWMLKFEETTTNYDMGYRNLWSEEFYQGRDAEYLMQGDLERKAQELIHLRGEWIVQYMGWLRKDMDQATQEAQELGVHIEEEEVEKLLSIEQTEIEMVLVDQICGWEEKLRKRVQGIIEDTHIEGEELEGQWRAGLWERVEAARQEMETRFAGTGKPDYIQHSEIESLGSVWQSLYEKLDARSSFPGPRQSPIQRLEKALELVDQKMLGVHRSHWFTRRLQGTKRRLRSEAEEVEAQLRRGLENYDKMEYYRDAGRQLQCIDLTHSRKKWQSFGQLDNDIISALKRNQNIFHIFTDRLPVDHLVPIFNAIPNLSSASCTQIPVNLEFPPNLLSISGFPPPLSDEQNEVLLQNRAQLENNQRTTFEFVDMKLCPDGGLVSDHGRVIVRFFGPFSGLLRLELTHCTHLTNPHPPLKVEMDDKSFVLEHSVPKSKSFEEIDLLSDDTASSSSGLVFKPGDRNILTFDFMYGYKLFDIELVDEFGNPYRPRNAGDDEQGAQLN